MDLIDDSEEVLIREQLQLRFRKPQNCAHLFHTNCLAEWFNRDASCPQCRLRVARVLEFDEAGRETAVLDVAPVFLEDVLEAEEEAEVAAEEEAAATRTPRRRRLPSAREVQRAARTETDNRIAETVREATERLRGRLAEDRARELRQQKAILAQIDPLAVRISIVKSLRRLPYNLQAPESGPVFVPTPKKPAARKPAAFIALKPPCYEQDFLGGGGA